MNYTRKEYLKNLISRNPFKSVYQGIYNLNSGDILGFEALGRIKAQSNFNIAEIIETCRLEDLLWDIEFQLRNNSINNFKIDKHFMLFLNVDPHIINAADFKMGITKCLLENSHLSESNIIFEITERSFINDYKPLVETLNYYKNQNYMVALDDVGSGYSGMRRIMETKPDFIKIDMELIRDIDSNDYKEIVVKSLIDISKKLNIKCIAEGIETANELEKIISLGVDYGQGFLLDRPSEIPTTNNPTAKNLILSLCTKSNNYGYDERYHHIGKLAKTIKLFDKKEKTSVIKDYLDIHNLESVCITDGDGLYGIVTKKSLNDHLSRMYGNALYYNKSVEKITDTNPTVIDYYSPIFNVSNMILKRSHENIYDNIIITKCSKYHGIVSIIDLLKYSYAREKNYYKELNPLTSLPGNPIINRVLNDSISSRTNKNVIYIDINKFKPFNDKFGFELGDQLLIETAKMLKIIIKKTFEYNSFLGHIGGDDFICVLDIPVNQAKLLCKKIILEFEKLSKKILSQQSEKTFSYICRDGNVKNFDKVGISISGIYGNLSSYKNIEILSKELGKIKKMAKSKNCSTCIIREI